MSLSYSELGNEKPVLSSQNQGGNGHRSKHRMRKLPHPSVVRSVWSSLISQALGVFTPYSFWPPRRPPLGGRDRLSCSGHCLSFHIWLPPAQSLSYWGTRGSSCIHRKTHPSSQELGHSNWPTWSKEGTGKGPKSSRVDLGVHP